MKLNKSTCLLNSTDVDKSFPFSVKLSDGALYTPLILAINFFDQCWQTLCAGVSAPGGSALVSTKVSGISRVRLPAQLVTKTM